MAEIKKYLDTTALGALVDQIKAEDAKVKAAAQKYTDDAVKLLDEAGAAATAESNAKKYTDELANGQVATNKADIEKLNGDASTEGSVAKAIADAKDTLEGSIGDVEAKADKNAEDIAAINNAESGILAQAKTYTDGKASEVQDNVDTLSETVADLDAYVGTIPETYEETNVIAYINKKAEETLNAASGGSSESAASVLQALNTYKAENDPKVTKNTEDIAKAQTAADGAQTYAEGVAADLATEVTNRTNADNALDERISDLEGTIVGLSGAMHFEGVKDAVPEDVTGYEQGDVIIVGNKEYVLNGEAFVEFGDASVNAEAITELTGRMTTAEGKITAAEGKITAVEGAVATKAEKTYVDEQVQALQGVDTGLDNRLKLVEAAVGESGSVADDIATAKQEAIDAAAADATSKANTAESNAKGHADSLNTAINTRVEALEAIDHEHKNFDLLETYTQTEANLADAVAKKHEHSNLSVIEGITSAKVTAWDAAEGNAKTYADGLNTTMQGVVDGIDARVTKNTEDIATKANASELADAVADIAENAELIAANTSAINSFTPITSDEVNALFA